VKGFREFLLRGNVIDLAVAVVIGAAFTAIVNAIVTAVIDPAIGALFNASSLKDTGVVTIPGIGGSHAALHFGAVLAAVVQFVLVAAVVYFALVLPVSRLKRIAFARTQRDVAQPSVAASPTDVEVLLEIRDLLRRQQGLPAADARADIAPADAPEGTGITGTTRL
jgi:large conductance mechanosensitive channel